MTVSPEDLHELLRRIRYDATAIQSKVTDAFGMLARLEVAPACLAVCDVCGLKCQGPRSLAEHAYTSHGGDLPAHWAQADELARSDA